MTRIDLNHVWDDARAMGAANRDLLIALAGMFLLLPSIIALQLLPEQLLPTQKPAGQAPDLGQLIQAYSQYVSANWHILFGRELLLGFGTLAMLVLLLGSDRPTVAQSLRLALILLPSYILAQLLSGLALLVGLPLILPFFYLLARFALVAPAAAAERQMNPIEMLRRSIVLTRGNGWRIFAVLAIIFVTAQLLLGIVMLLVGVVAGLVLPADLAQFAEHIASSIVLAAIGIITSLIMAALYRGATAAGSR